MNVIENWYDSEYDEWSRLDRHKIEFEITKRYMNTYITGNSLEILDIGGGPGRYSFYLAEKGHQVTLLDLSQHHIDIAREKSKELDISLADYIKGDALDLTQFSQERFDVVLLMGPLYHLINKEGRQKAIMEALRVLKKGGFLIASFISKYAPLNEAMKYLEFTGEESEVDNLLHYLENGENEDGNGFTMAYFIGVEEAQSLMADVGLKQHIFAGVEGVLGFKEEEAVNLPAEEFKKCIDIVFAVSQDKYLLGASNHFLYIGQK